eukprot:9752772-Heterocapsa_arctica.AAC.1
MAIAGTTKPATSLEPLKLLRWPDRSRDEALPVAGFRLLTPKLCQDTSIDQRGDTAFEQTEKECARGYFMVYHTKADPDRHFYHGRR